MKLKLLVGAVLSSVVLATSSFAATLTYSSLTTADLSGITPVLNPEATSTTGGYLSNVQGNQYSDGGSLIARTPWEGSINEDLGWFSSVQSGSSVTFEFNSIQTVLSMIWGSPDTYNDLVIQLTGGGGTQTINGSAVFGTSGILASAVTITGVQFESVTLTSGSNAFEFANLAAVPLPAGGLLLFSAFGGLAAFRRRKSK